MTRQRMRDRGHRAGQSGSARRPRWNGVGPGGQGRAGEQFTGPRGYAAIASAWRPAAYSRAHELGPGAFGQRVRRRASTRSSPTRLGSLAEGPGRPSIRSARTPGTAARLAWPRSLRRGPIPARRPAAGPARRAARRAGSARPAPRRHRPGARRPCAAQFPRRPSHRPRPGSTAKRYPAGCDSITSARPRPGAVRPAAGKPVSASALPGVCRADRRARGSPASEPAGTTRPAFQARAK